MWASCINVSKTLDHPKPYLHGSRIAQQQCDKQEVAVLDDRHNLQGMLSLSGCATPLQHLHLGHVQAHQA